MKWKKKNKILFLSLCFLSATAICVAQENEKKTLSLNIGYYVKNNNTQYLMATVQTKVEGKFQPVKDIAVSLFLDSVSDDNLINKVKTDEKGKAKAYLPISLKNKWDVSTNHTILGMIESSDQFEEATSELTITKSKIEIDTSSDEETRSIIVTIKKFENDEWVPVKDVDVKIGIARMGGILSAGDEEFYTTDSSGQAIAELNKQELPGDKDGNLVLAAKVDDNDEVGSIIIEKTVPWGKPTEIDKDFFKQRTLWSTRYHTPPWLLFMAYSIIIGVWGTILYLIFQLLKIKKLGSVETKNE